jgi:starch synthase (maltosyl-transferring)
MADQNHGMPAEGRKRVIIEDVRPAVDAGRFAVKRLVQDVVRVNAAIYGDGHDHVAANLLYRHDRDTQWRKVRMQSLGNDQWTGEFVPDVIGLWFFRIDGWIDHFDTWSTDLEKRISFQVETVASSETDASAKDVWLALQTGAQLLTHQSLGASGKDAALLKAYARSFQKLANSQTLLSQTPVTRELVEATERNPDLLFSTQSDEYPVRADRRRAGYSTWYEFFPRSAGEAGRHGTLRDAAALIPTIAEAGFDVIYLPPIHPIGRAYRKGRNNNVKAAPDEVGSPWAIGNEQGGHTAIAPELGSFADFDAMLRVAEDSGAEIALDIAFQCSPDHPWVKSHPDWFLIRPDGSIQYAENPPKKYQDIYPLNFESPDWRNLWEELSEVFLFWVKRGVKIFRVDNPHTKALPFWEWCIGKVQQTNPEVLFLSEAFTRPHLMYGLAKRGFTQSYTYFTWRNTKEELTSYLEELTSEPVCEFFRPNFWPNTPDILPVGLQKGGRPAFVQRVILAATLAANYGLYGPAYELMDARPFREGGEEYYDSEKYQVRVWDRNHPDSLMPLLVTLNTIRREHSSLQQNNTLRFHETDNPTLLCYSKREGEDRILVVVNLDTINTQSGWTRLDMGALGLSEGDSFECRDLLQSGSYRWSGPRNFVLLDPHVSPAHIFHVRSSDSDNGKVR